MKTITRFVRIMMVWTFLSSHAAFAQQSTTEKIIRAYYAAYEKKDWGSMEKLLADGFTFSSPNDDHINVMVYKERCWPNAYKIKNFDLVKLIINGDDAFVTYNG